MTGREPASSFEWRWVDIGGEQHRVPFDELVQALGRRRLPPQVLVWRAGWLEWLPAANIPELNHALGTGHSGAPLVVRTDPDALAPPPPPLALYAKTVPRGTLTLERTRDSSAPPPAQPPRAGARQGVPGPSQPPPPGAGRIPIRKVPPASSEPVLAGRVNTLRPAGAVAPPARGAQQPPKRPPGSSIPPPRPGAVPNASRTPLPSVPAKAPPAPPAPAPKPPVAPPPRSPGALPPVYATVPPLNIPAAPQRKADPLPPRAPSSAPPPPSSRKPPAPSAVEPIASVPTVLSSEPVAPVTPEDPSRDVVVSGAPAPAPEKVRPPPPEAVKPPPGPPVTEPPPAKSGSGLSRRTITVLTSAAVMIPGVTLLALALLRGPQKHEKAPVVKPSAVASTVVLPPAPSGCELEKPAQRLAESAYLAVPTLLAPAPDGVSVALGLAAAKEHALGLVIDPASLAVTPAFEQTVSGSTTLGVVPLVRSGVLEFTVDRAGGALASARTIDAPKRFTIGTTSEGITRAVGSATEVVWPRDAKIGNITTPRVASIAGTRYAVVFRQGGQDGSEAVGWLREDGTKLTDLRAVKTDAKLVGTPAISADEHRALIAFAGKPAAPDPWHVELAAVPDGALPEQSKPFTLPASGPGGEAISPASEPIGGGRFLLQWTEGSAGNRAVRVQVLSADLQGVGDPITLSATDQNAGQGALFAKGKQVLALFLVQKDASDELWGATLKCP